MRKIFITIVIIIVFCFVGVGMVNAACNTIDATCCDLTGTEGAWTGGNCDDSLIKNLECDLYTGKCLIVTIVGSKEGSLCANEKTESATTGVTKTEYYCLNGMLCDLRKNNPICVKTEINIDNLNELCLGSHGWNIQKNAYVCITDQTFNPPDGGSSIIGGGRVGDAELPDYPDGVGFKFKDATLGTVIGKIIEYIYIFAGFALLIALLMGGFTVLTAAGSPEKAAKGYNQATYGVIGFILIFVSYMVVLLIQAIFHVKIFF